jgi:hypothetical protein
MDEGAKEKCLREGDRGQPNRCEEEGGGDVKMKVLLLKHDEALTGF